MIEIRSLSEGDLPAVEGLLDRFLPDWGGDRAFLEATVLRHPWAEEELTSLVAYGDDGELVGFIGAQVRRMRFGERELRGICCSHLVVAPDRRVGAAGALLLGRLLSGEQDLTWSDSATEIVARMWRTFGGELDHSRACDWMLVLRPAGWLGSWVKPALERKRIGRELVPVGAFPLHVFRRDVVRELSAEVTGENASSEQIVEELPALSARTRLYVDYDVPHLEHLLTQIRAHEGDLVCRIVRLRGRPIGWYAYLPRRATASRVLHIAGPERHLDAVVGELVDDAYSRGSRVLAGRLEPHLDAPLRGRLAAIGLAREPVIHSKDPELKAALASRSALLTQLDSEWFVT